MGLFDYLLQKATGKRRGDINLPNESGEVDPRLPKPKPKVETDAERNKRFRDENRRAAGR